MEHEKSKKVYSASKEACKYPKEFSLNFDNSGEVDTWKPARKLKQESKKLDEKQLEENWTQKPLHRQFLLRMLM